MPEVSPAALIDTPASRFTSVPVALNATTSSTNSLSVLLLGTTADGTVLQRAHFGAQPAPPATRLRLARTDANLPHLPKIADFTGDGQPDVFATVVDAANKARAVVVAGPQFGSLRSCDDCYADGRAPDDTLVADLDGDGRSDLFQWRGSTTRALIGRGDGGFRAAGALPALPGTGTDAREFLLADFGGNDKDMPALVRYQDGTHLWALDSLAADSASWRLLFTTGQRAGKDASWLVADTDGDGRDELHAISVDGGRMQAFSIAPERGASGIARTTLDGVFPAAGIRFLTGNFSASPGEEILAYWHDELQGLTTSLLEHADGGLKANTAVVGSDDVCCGARVLQAQNSSGGNRLIVANIDPLAGTVIRDIAPVAPGTQRRTWRPAPVAVAAGAGPAVVSAVFVDEDDSYSVSAGDLIRVELASQPPADLRLGAFRLLGAGASLGADAVLVGVADRTATIRLGRDPVARVAGRFGQPAASGVAPTGVSAGSNVVDLTDQRVHEIRIRFDERLAVRKPTMEKWATEGNSYWYYYLANLLEGVTSMFEATGDKEYLDLAIHYSNAVLDNAKDVNEDGYLDFVANHTTSSGQVTFNNTPDVRLHDWRVFRPIARLQRIVGADPVLRQQYAQNYERYADFIDEHVVRKWSERYRRRNAPRHSFESESLIHRVAHIGDVLVDYYLDTNATMGRVGLVHVAERMKQQIRPSEGAAGTLEWNILYRDTGAIKRDRSSLLGVSDVGHASGTVSFIAAEAMGTRRVFGADDLNGLTRTLLKVIWNGDRENPGFADFVDGGMSSTEPNKYGTSHLSDGWIKLGAWDAEAQRLFMDAWAADKTGLFPLQYMGNLARNFQRAVWY